MATYTGSDKRLQYLFSETADIRDSLADFSGATAETDGTRGLVIAPLAGEQERFLRGDGTWAEVQGGGGLPGQGYTGSDLILRDAEGNISGVWYMDGQGNWVEYTKGAGGSGHSFGWLIPTAADTIRHSISISEV